MNSRIITTGTLIVAALLIAATVAAPALATQRNNLATSNQAGSNTQNGLVNLGNTQVGANVGANVCALSTNC
jgi:phage-related tail fiber protein